MSVPSTAKRFYQLTPARQRLVRIMQLLTFGFIEALEVRAGEPVFSPAPTIVAEVKLESDNVPPPAIDLTDFELRAEVCSLMDALAALHDGSVMRIDVRYGIPRRLLIERSVREVGA